MHAPDLKGGILVRGIIADLPEVHEKQDNLLARISQHAGCMKMPEGFSEKTQVRKTPPLACPVAMPCAGPVHDDIMGGIPAIDYPTASNGVSNKIFLRRPTGWGVIPRRD